MASSDERINIVVDSLFNLALAEGLAAFRRWRERRRYLKETVFVDLAEVESLLQDVDRVCDQSVLLYSVIPDSVANGSIGAKYKDTIEAVAKWVDEVLHDIDEKILPVISAAKDKTAIASTTKRRKRLSDDLKKYIESAKKKSEQLRVLMNEWGSTVSSSLIADIGKKVGQSLVMMQQQSDSTSTIASLAASWTSVFAAGSPLLSMITAMDKQLKEDNERRHQYEDRFGHLVTKFCQVQLQECLRVNIAEYLTPDRSASSYFLHKVFVSVPCVTKSDVDGFADDENASGALELVCSRLQREPGFRALLVGGPGYGKSSVLQALSAMCHVCYLEKRKPGEPLFATGVEPLPLSDVRNAFQNRCHDSNGDGAYIEKSTDKLVEMPIIAIGMTFKELDAQLKEHGTLMKVICNRMIILSGTLDRISLDDFHEFMSAILRSQHSLFIFDGLDEIFDDGRRKQLLLCVSSFLDAVPANCAFRPSCIVSCRPLTSGIADLQTMHGFRGIQLCNLPAFLIARYASSLLQTVYNVKPKTDGRYESFLSSIREAASARYFGKCCLQVAMVTDIVRQGYSLPTSKPKLFELFVRQVIDREVLFKLEQFRASGGFSITRDEVTRFHRWCGILLYYERLCGNTSPLPRMRFERLADRMFLIHGITSEEERRKKVDDLMKACEERFCLLVSNTPTTLEFAVQSFLEYFAAEFLFEEVGCFTWPGLQVGSTRLLLKETAIMRKHRGEDQLFSFVYGGAFLGRAQCSRDDIIQLLKEMNASSMHIGSYAALAILADVQLSSQSETLSLVDVVFENLHPSIPRYPLVLLFLADLRFYDGLLMQSCLKDFTEDGAVRGFIRAFRSEWHSKAFGGMSVKDALPCLALLFARRYLQARSKFLKDETDSIARGTFVVPDRLGNGFDIYGDFDDDLGDGSCDRSGDHLDENSEEVLNERGDLGDDDQDKASVLPGWLKNALRGRKSRLPKCAEDPLIGSNRFISWYQIGSLISTLNQFFTPVAQDHSSDALRHAFTDVIQAVSSRRGLSLLLDSSDPRSEVAHPRVALNAYFTYAFESAWMLNDRLFVDFCRVVGAPITSATEKEELEFRTFLLGPRTHDKDVGISSSTCESTIPADD
jgi:hypothetical protein